MTNPEVYKSSVSDCYVVFGELKTEDTSAQAQAAQAQQMAQAEQQERMLTEQFSKLGADAGNADKKKEEEEEDDGEPIDEEGVDAKDIDLVMQQVSKSIASPTAYMASCLLTLTLFIYRCRAHEGKQSKHSRRATET